MNPSPEGGTDLGTAPVIALVVRSGFVESVHHGIVAVTGPDGSLSWSVGPAELPILPRSCNKPLQAVGLLRAGLRLDGDLLALACASHSGEPFHLDGVRRILAGAGLSEDDLQNTPDFPYDEEERAAWLRAGRSPSRIAQNCSGKHAAMLAACVANGWEAAEYLDPRHPVQAAVSAAVASLAGEPVAATGVDGCGAPVLAISCAGLARAFGRLAVAPEGTAERRVASGIQAAPQWLGGSRRDVTALLRAVPGSVAKDGAESVYAVGLPDGRGVAVKVADGGQRARAVVMSAALRRLGVTSAELDRIGTVPVLGHGAPVGGVEAVLP